jgi:hypothetical protein
MTLPSKKLILVACISLLFSLPAAAQNDYDQLNDPFRIYLGGFWPSIDSQININGEVVPPGPPISIEDQLGVEDSKGVAWGGVNWRISQRNSLEFETFSLKRDGGESGTFSPWLQVGDTFIESGAIATSFDTSVSRLTYGFSLMRSDRMDLQVKAGLHIASLDVGLQLSGNVCDLTTMPTMPPGCPVATTGAENEDVTAPLPHFGGSFAYAFSPSLLLRLQAIGFAIEIDSIDGSLFEADADLTWQPFRNFGGGIGIRYFNTNVEATGSDLDGEFDFEYFGPVVFIQATF